MNLYYLLAVFGTRILNFFVIIFLSHAMSGEAFGRYSLVTTNALFLHLFFSAWIGSSLWRDASRAHDAIDGEVAITSAIWLACRIAGIEILASIAGFFYLPPGLVYLSAILLLAPTFLISETVLTALNGRGQFREYGMLAFLRGIFTLVLAILLIALGFGLAGAITSQLIGILFAVSINREARRLIANAVRKRPSMAGIGEKIRFGAIGTVALNLYMINNALARNVLALRLGEAQAGYFSLAADLFYAPIALFAMAFSLSKIPELYQASSGAADDRPVAAADASAKQFLLANFAVAMPYAVGGWFAAPELGRLLLSPEVASHISGLARWAAVQGSCFTMLSAITTLALTSSQIRKAVTVSTAAVFTSIVPLALVLPSAHTMAVTFTLALTMTAAVALLFQNLSSPDTLPLSPIARICTATVALAFMLMAIAGLLHGVWVAAVSVIAAVPLYLASGWLLKSKEITGLLRVYSPMSKARVNKWD